MPQMRKSALYFTDAEMRCRGHKCCGNKLILDPLFDKKLLELRITFGLPMRVNSCCRCKEHNERVGGKPKSFHISDRPAWDGVEGTAAIDVGYYDLDYRNRLARTAWKLGWRIGFNKHFLHLDSGFHHGVVRQSVFKYDNVSDEELETFKKQIGLTWLEPQPE